MERRRKGSIIGAVAGGLLLFCVYFFSMRAVISASTVVRVLLVPTIFGALAGGVLGREFGVARGSASARRGTEEEGGDSVLKDDEVEQKNVANVKGDEE